MTSSELPEPQIAEINDQVAVLSEKIALQKRLFEDRISSEKKVLKFSLVCDAVMLGVLVFSSYIAQYGTGTPHRIFGILIGGSIAASSMLHLYYVLRNFDEDPAESQTPAMIRTEKVVRWLILALNGKLVYVGVVLYLFIMDRIHLGDKAPKTIALHSAFMIVKILFVTAAALLVVSVIIWNFTDRHANRQSKEAAIQQDADKRFRFFMLSDILAIVTWICIAALLLDENGPIGQYGLSAIGYLASLYFVLVMLRKARLLHRLFNFSAPPRIYR